jgi:hypothetical protein
MDRYQTFEFDAEHEAKFVDEEWMDREHFIVYQLFVNYDFAHNTTMARVFKYLDSWVELGKQYCVLFQNSLGELFRLNENIAPEFHTHREYTGNVMGHILMMFRYHLKVPIAFVGFGCRIDKGAEGVLRTETIDTLRQRNRALMRDKIYATDVLSYSSCLNDKLDVLDSWRHNRVRYTLLNFALAILEEWEEPYLASSLEAGTG